MPRPPKYNYSELLIRIEDYIAKNPDANQAEICFALNLPKNYLAKLKDKPDFAKLLEKFTVPRHNKDELYKRIKHAKQLYPFLGINELSKKMGFCSSRLSVLKREDSRIAQLLVTRKKSTQNKQEKKAQIYFSKVPIKIIKVEEFHGCKLANKYREMVYAGELKFGQTLGVNFNNTIISIAAKDKHSNLRIWDGREEFVEDKFYTNGYRRLYRLKPSFR